MPDYQKGKIYKLWSPQGTEEEVYYGSTIDDLRKRKNHHKNTNFCNSRILFEKYDDIRIELVEEYPCNSKAELLKKEGEYIKNNKCLNRNIPTRTPKEWYNDNKNYVKEYKKNYQQINKEELAKKQKNYKDKNKEFLKEKITCECGCLISRPVISIHKKTPKHIKLMEEINN